MNVLHVLSSCLPPLISVDSYSVQCLDVCITSSSCLAVTLSERNGCEHLVYICSACSVQILTSSDTTLLKLPVSVFSPCCCYEVTELDRDDTIRPPMKVTTLLPYVTTRHNLSSQHDTPDHLHDTLGHCFIDEVCVCVSDHCRCDQNLPRPAGYDEGETNNSDSQLISENKEWCNQLIDDWSHVCRCCWTRWEGLWWPTMETQYSER